MGVNMDYTELGDEIIAWSVPAIKQFAAQIKDVANNFQKVRDDCKTLIPKINEAWNSNLASEKFEEKLDLGLLLHFEEGYHILIGLSNLLENVANIYDECENKIKNQDYNTTFSITSGAKGIEWSQNGFGVVASSDNNSVPADNGMSEMQNMSMEDIIKAQEARAASRQAEISSIKYDDGNIEFSANSAEAARPASVNSSFGPSTVSMPDMPVAPTEPEKPVEPTPQYTTTQSYPQGYTGPTGPTSPTDSYSYRYVADDGYVYQGTFANRELYEQANNEALHAAAERNKNLGLSQDGSVTIG